MTAIAKESAVSFPHMQADRLLDIMTQSAAEQKK
jgi:hypothetical protein